MTAPPKGTCWLVTIGIESDTLMIAFLFSEVITWGLESTLMRFSEASAFMIIMNWSDANVNAVSPPPRAAAGPG